MHARCLEEDKTLKDKLTMARTMAIALKQAECMEKNGQNHSGSIEESIDNNSILKILAKTVVKTFPKTAASSEWTCKSSKNIHKSG